MSAYGVDVAATRADDLDKKVLAAVAARVARGQQPTVLDAGCGSGGLTARLAVAGADVTAVDVADYATTIANLPMASGGVTFTQADVREFVRNTQQQFDFAVLQRVLHYVPYLQAKELLTQLATKTNTTLFVSVTGTLSDIGKMYPATHQPLPERWATLPPEAQKTFSIFEPICLYTAEELSQLLRECGWELDELWTSAFGNHKAVARPANKPD